MKKSCPAIDISSSNFFSQNISDAALTSITTKVLDNAEITLLQNSATSENEPQGNLKLADRLEEIFR